MNRVRLLPLVAALVAGLCHGGAGAAEGSKPYAQYWMSVSTQNMTIPGMSASEMGMLGGLMGRGGPGMGPQRDLRLQLVSPQATPRAPEAGHDIPPGQDMGPMLPLLVPERDRPVRVERGGMEGRSEEMEKPKGRMLIYWGCGDKVRAGQPRVLDVAKASPADFARMMSSRQPTHQSPPAPRAGWTYADWPNRESQLAVPRDSSLQGGQLVHANFAPDIRFTIGAQHDFMNPVEFTSVTGGLADSIAFQWRSIPTAIGYFSMAMGSGGQGADTVFWSSSEVADMGWGLLDYMSPADVRRFIKEKVVMTPGTTSCAIPQGIFKDAEGAMLQFIAYGDELNVVHPPRPADPKQAWQPIWSAKVRLKSTGMATLGQEEHRSRASRGERGGRSYTSEPRSQQGRSYTSDQPAARRGGEDSVLDKVNKIRGLLPF